MEWYHWAALALIIAVVVVVEYKMYTAKPKQDSCDDNSCGCD